MVKRNRTAIILALVLLCSLFALPASAAGDYEVRYGYAAEALWEDGLFLGTGSSFALDKPVTRAAGVTMLVRLLGKEAEAKAGTYTTPFTDTKDAWMQPYIGYAYENKLTNGTSETNFSPNAPMTATQFMTLVLRAMGYDDAAGDFTWDKAADKALEIGLIDKASRSEYSAGGVFYRDNAALISYTALSLTKKGGDVALSDTITVPGRPAGNMPKHTDAIAEAEKYPFLESGYWHYQVKINGVTLPLAHDALMAVSNNNDNEILFPYSDILDYYGVAYFWNRANDDFSTVVNGVSVTHDCNDSNFMWYSTETHGYHNSVTPGNINGVYYVPNHTFEFTIDANVPKIAKGSEATVGAINITTSSAFTWGKGSTEIAIRRWNDARGEYVPDGEDPVTDPEPENPPVGTCPTCHGSGKLVCPSCLGVGSTMSGQFVYDPFTKTMVQKQVWQDCPLCIGGGSICPTCGGTGRR